MTKDYLKDYLEGNRMTEVEKLLMIFPKGFINGHNELILDTRNNLYFCLNNCTDRKDYIRKVLSSCSRDCCKSQPYEQDWKNEQYNNDIRMRVNFYLGTFFTRDDFYLIYSYLGNGVNSNLADKFIDSNFDLDVLRQHEVEE